MAWVVDTCLLIDVAEADPHFGVSSAQFLDRLRPEGLIICPMSQVASYTRRAELLKSPRFQTEGLGTQALRGSFASW
jgi:hypothetical protein